MNTTAIKSFALAIPLVALATVGSAAFAHQGGFGGFERGERPELTDEQEATLEQVRELRQAGNYDEAKNLAESAGLPGKGMRGNGGMHRGNGEVREAIESNDYAAFVEATQDAPFADDVTPELFVKMIEAHALHEAGDHEGAREVMDELGIKPPHKGKGGPGKFFHRNGENLTDAQKALAEEARELHQNGDHDAARAIMDQLRDSLKGDS